MQNFSVMIDFNCMSSGIGIVNAVEVMNAFPEEDGLHKFKEWIESPDPSILGTLGAKTGLSARKRGQKASENDATCSNSNVRDGSASEENIDKDLKENIDVKQNFMVKHVRYFSLTLYFLTHSIFLDQVKEDYFIPKFFSLMIISCPYLEKC